MTDDIEDRLEALAERPHAPFGFSRLPALAVCPGFIGAPGTSAAAERGTRIGDLLAQWVVTQEIDDRVNGPDHEALRYGADILQGLHRRDYTWEAEPRLDTSIEGVWGYADVVGLDSLLGERAILVELKTGWGTREPAVRNAQVQGLALALLERGYAVVDAYLIECDQKRTTAARWSFEDLPILRAIVAGIVAGAQAPVEQALTPNGACAYCARASLCPALVQAPERALAAARRSTVLSPQDYVGALSTEAVAAVLDRAIPAVELADKYLGLLKARAVALLEEGAAVPGYRLAVSSGARGWIDEAAAQAALADAGYSLEQVGGLASPAQVEKRLGKAVKPLVATLTTAGIRKSLKADKAQLEIGNDA